MKIRFSKSATADVHVFIVDEGGKLPKAAAELDAATSGLLATALNADRFSGKPGEMVSVVLPKDSGAKKAVLLGGGKPKKRDERSLEMIGALVARALATSGAKSVALYGAGDGEMAARAALGFRLGAYRFDTYRTKLTDKDKRSVDSFTVVTDGEKAAKAAWAGLEAACAGTELARDLMNEPPNVLHPESFAERMKAELEPLGVAVTILGEAAMEKLGMRSMLGVGQGSVRESQLVVMEWKGAEAKAPLTLVGKGVCFDTGGISLKPGPQMEDMKGDMGGAAAVCGAMKTLAMRKASAHVVGLIGLVENMPDGNAQRPGDIVTAADGQTIEIQNTDAEGRLVLCDVLWYAQEHHKPSAIVDLATLTGAIVISLGHEHAGLFSNDDALSEALRLAGEAEGETVWRMPMGDNYDKLLKSKFADMRNIGGRSAGSITAAQFLRRFVREGQAWAHIDIAGVAWKEGEKSPLDPSWASGYGPRLLDRLVRDNYES